MTDAKIAAAAKRWDEARIEAIALKKKRASFLCERTEKHEAFDGGPVMEPTNAACWRRYKVHGDDARRLDPEEQCQSCRDRYATHLALREATKRRGANLRAMMALVAAARRGQNENAPRESGPHGASSSPGDRPPSTA